MLITPSQNLRLKVIMRQNFNELARLECITAIKEFFKYYTRNEANKKQTKTVFFRVYVLFQIKQFRKLLNSPNFCITGALYTRHLNKFIKVIAHETINQYMNQNLIFCLDKGLKIVPSHFVTVCVLYILHSTRL